MKTCPEHPQGTFLARRWGDATFNHAPANYHVFAATGSSEEAGVEALQLNFAGTTTLTEIKVSNRDFAIQHGGSCYVGNHYSSGQSCTLLVRFTPRGPGHRVGFLKVAHSAQTDVATFGLVGNGYAPVISFVPSTITTVPSSVSSGVGTISGATSMAMVSDVLYVADTGNSKLKEMDSAGTLLPSASSPIATPASVAVDSFGIVYTANVHSATYYFSLYYPWGSETAYGFTYVSSTCTVSAPCAFSAVGMNYPANMSIDNYNNLFFEEGTTGAAEMPVTNISGGTGTLNLWHLSDQFAYSSGSPGSFAVDAYGDLFTNYGFPAAGTCYLLEESLYNAEYSPSATRVAGGTACGFSGDGGLARSAEISTKIGQMAFDAAGNLYFADSGNQRARRIEAGTGVIRTIAGNGLTGFTGDGGWATHAELSNPTGVAVDSQGQVYILSGDTAGTAQVIRKTTTLGRQLWGSTTTGTTSSPLQVVVTNSGNANMVLTGSSFSGSTSGDFKVDTLTTNCPLTAGSTLSPGQSCNIGFTFTPSAVGTRYGYYNLRSNTVAGLSQILLSGSGVAPAVAKFVTPTSSSAVAANAALTVKVAVTSSYSIAPTGTVTFKVDGVQVGSPVAVVDGLASIPVKSFTVGSHTLLAIYSGDKNTATSRVSETISAKAAAASN